MRTARLVPFIATAMAAACVLAPAAATSQTVAGTVVDPASRERLSVSLELVDGAGAVVRQATSGEGGRFAITAPRRGLYRLRARRIGYATTVSEPVWLSPGDTTLVELQLDVEAVALDPLKVLATREPVVPILDTYGYYERRELYDVKMGVATFLSPQDIEDSRAFRPTDLFRDIDGVRLRHMGGRTVDVTTIGGGRIPIYINGTRVARRGETLNELIAVGDIGAVEIYPRMSPAEYGGFAAIAIWIRYW